MIRGLGSEGTGSLFLLLTSVCFGGSNKYSVRLVLENHQKIFLTFRGRSKFADALILIELHLSQLVPPSTVNKFVDFLSKVAVEGIFFVH